MARSNPLCLRLCRCRLAWPSPGEGRGDARHDGVVRYAHSTCMYPPLHHERKIKCCAEQPEGW
eukprot:54912-Prymnesium_polylepis.1